MTLSQQNRTRLVSFITDHRKGWDDAGTEAAIKALDLRWPNEPLRVAAEAIRWAQEARAESPAAMHDEKIQQRIVGQTAAAPKPAPRHDDPVCAVHGGNATTVHGGFVCCQQAAAETSPRPISPAPASLRPSGPCPAELKAVMDAKQREFQVQKVRQG